MRTDVTIRHLYWNPSLMGFFFRDQARETLMQLLDSVDVGTESAIYTIDSYCEDNDLELDDAEELFYSESTEELAEMFGLEFWEED